MIGTRPGINSVAELRGQRAEDRGRHFTMTDTKQDPMDKLALALCLGGVGVAAAVAILGKLLDQDFALIAYGIFVAFQVAALVLGIVARARPLGKAAAITSGVLLVGSFVFLSHQNHWSEPRAAMNACSECDDELFCAADGD